MFKQRFNQIRIDLSIEPRGPLLIRSGRQGAHPERPSLEAVRTTVDGEPTVFIPGSSLKGVLRSHAETLLRTEGLTITDPFDGEAQQRFSAKDPCTVTYPNSCPIGRTFGNVHLKGHVSVTDLIPGGREPSGSQARQHHVNRANRVERRNGVGIDRLLGSAFGGALYDAEAVVQGRFDGKVLLINAQLYQLALVLAVLRDLDDGFLALGSSTTRGFGQVSVHIERLLIESKAPAKDDRLRGVGELFSGGEAYGFFEGDLMPRPDYVDIETPRLLWQRWSVPGGRWAEFSQDLLGSPWQAFMSQAKKVGSWKA